MNYETHREINRKRSRMLCVLVSANRGESVFLPSGAKSVGLPARPFLYTIDQISSLVELSVETLKQRYVYFEGRSIGSRHKHFMVARNIAPADQPPEWRITEREFVRWMKHKGFRHYERTVFPN